MINQNRRKKRLRRVRKARNLPYRPAPELPVLPEMRRDVDRREMLGVEDGEKD